MADDPELRRLLLFLLGGSRGGENRARIIRSLRAKPNNLNRLAGELGLQYKAVQHHMRILVANSLVITSGERYGLQYSLTPCFAAHIDIFEQVCEKFHFESSCARPKSPIYKKDAELERLWWKNLSCIFGARTSRRRSCSPTSQRS